MSDDNKKNDPALSRRDFLRTSLLTAGAILTGSAALEAFARDKSPNGFKFVVVSDTHFGHPGDTKRFYTALPYIRREKPDFVLHTGDVVNSQVSTRRELRIARRALRKLPRPLYVIPGNHDIRWSEDAALLKRWKSVFGPTEITFQHKGWSFVGLNSMALTSNCSSRDLEQEIFSWLEFQAPTFTPGRTLLFYHIPNYKLPVNWSWMPGWTPTAKERWKKLVQQVKPLAGIAGHWHLGVQVQSDAGPVVVAPSLSGRFNLPTGYLRCTIKGDKLLAERIMLETENKREIPALVKLFLLPRAKLPGRKA